MKATGTVVPGSCGGSYRLAQATSMNAPNAAMMPFKVCSPFKVVPSEKKGEAMRPTLDPIFDVLWNYIFKRSER